MIIVSDVGMFGVVIRAPKISPPQLLSERWEWVGTFQMRRVHSWNESWTATVAAEGWTRWKVGYPQRENLEVLRKWEDVCMRCARTHTHRVHYNSLILAIFPVFLLDIVLACCHHINLQGIAMVYVYTSTTGVTEQLHVWAEERSNPPHPPHNNRVKLDEGTGQFWSPSNPLNRKEKNSTVCCFPTVCDVLCNQLPTSSDGKNLLSFSTTTSLLTPLLSMERVRAPGPGPTSHTQHPRMSPARRTSLSSMVVNSLYICPCAIMTAHQWHSGPVESSG